MTAGWWGHLFGRYSVRKAVFAGLIVLAAGLLAVGPGYAAPWPRSDIPSDPNMTFGELANGMRYAVMHNATPSGAVSIRLLIAAGAVQEGPSERGLAHFTEHMAFRGSSRIPDGEINRILERLGLRLGSDTNAFTLQEQTLYRFDLPRSDSASMETALGIAREIAGNLTLDPAIVQAEASVIQSELKLRETPAQQAQAAQMAFALQDTRASALPNGDPAALG